MPSVAEVAGAFEDSPRFPTVKTKEDHEVKMFVTQEGWHEREGRGRYLRSDSSVNRTLEPWPEFGFAELAKKRLEIANKTI
jgi:hypothetical protein